MTTVPDDPVAAPPKDKPQTDPSVPMPAEPGAPPDPDEEPTNDTSPDEYI